MAGRSINVAFIMAQATSAETFSGPITSLPGQNERAAEVNVSFGYKMSLLTKKLH